MAKPKLDPSVNEKLADQIQGEKWFIVKRFPENAIGRLGAINLYLLVLQVLLIVSNNVHHLGLWESFVGASTRYRDGFNRSFYEKTSGGVDFTKIESYHLWRGFVVPSLLGCSAYVVTALLCLRHELYQWKPELLQHYAKVTAQSRVGSWIPTSWLNSIFRLYKDKHRKHTSNTIQSNRKHAALQDLAEFGKVLRQVGFNLFISLPALLVMWLALLQTKVETRNILQLPRSYVPIVQGLIWYLCNDILYFYPHWIAHSASLADPKAQRHVLLPHSVVKFIHKQFKESHRLHHRCKANIGVAAWYCSVWEQLLFNLFPALVGPVLTQLAADALGIEHIWGTHLVTLYVWITAAAASSVLAHTGYRSIWNDPGQHDLHHERAFDPKLACNFGTFGILDRLHGTKSEIAAEDTRIWRGQHDRQAALYEAERRSGIPLTEEQMTIVKQPNHGLDWSR
jgi:sterol desaturase/sphingolipid hydroxylase (fatty acid hydroxylase superfamily)